MFTGIIEETGWVESICQSGEYCSLIIKAPKILEDASLGDSIAVNGICLTVSQKTTQSFQADVM